MSAIKHAAESVAHGIEHAAKDVAHGLETAGKDIEKVGKGVVDGVETIGKTLAKDVESTVAAAAESVGDMMQGRMHEALNKAMEAGQDLAKTGYDTATAGEQATVDSLANMHLNKKMDKAMGKAETGMQKIGTAVKTGVGQVEQTLKQDAGAILKDAKQTGNDLIHGHFQAALDDSVKTAEDGIKGFADLSTAGIQSTLNTLANTHISKGMDKVMGKVDQGFDAVKNDAVKSADQVTEQVVDGTESAIKSTVQAAKDAAQGHWGAAMGDLGNAGMDALQAAGDLTPEGAMASVGAQMLMNAHIGNAQLDGAIAGALHGNVAEMAKGVVKNVGEMEAGNAATSFIENHMPQGGGAGSTLGMAAAGFAAGAAMDGLHGKRGGEEAGDGATHSFGKASGSGGVTGGSGSSKFSVGEQLGKISGGGSDLSVGEHLNLIRNNARTSLNEQVGKFSGASSNASASEHLNAIRRNARRSLGQHLNQIGNGKFASVTERLGLGKGSAHTAEPEAAAPHGASASGTSSLRERLGFSKHSAHTADTPEAESAQDKKQKKEDVDDNAQNAANNTIANDQAGGTAQIDQLMLEMFMLQAGMSQGSNGENKRREELAAN